MFYPKVAKKPKSKGCTQGEKPELPVRGWLQVARPLEGSSLVSTKTHHLPAGTPHYEEQLPYRG